MGGGREGGTCVMALRGWTPLAVHTFQVEDFSHLVTLPTITPVMSLHVLATWRPLDCLPVT